MRDPVAFMTCGHGTVVRRNSNPLVVNVPGTAACASAIDSTGSHPTARRSSLAGSQDPATLAPSSSSTWHAEKTPRRQRFLASAWSQWCRGDVTRLNATPHVLPVKTFHGDPSTLVSGTSTHVEACASAIPPEREFELESRRHRRGKAADSLESSREKLERLALLDSGTESPTPSTSAAGALRVTCRLFAAGTMVGDACPHLIDQWHPELNGDRTPGDVTYGSRFKAWWMCPEDEGHVWQASVKHRSRGAGCPFCDGKMVSPTNSLAARHPDVAAEWHPERNGAVTPADVVACSSRKIWFRCARDSAHEWRASAHSRTLLGAGCPVCSRRFRRAPFWARDQTPDEDVEDEKDAADSVSPARAARATPRASRAKAAGTSAAPRRRSSAAAVTPRRRLAAKKRPAAA